MHALTCPSPSLSLSVVGVRLCMCMCMFICVCMCMCLCVYMCEVGPWLRKASLPRMGLGGDVVQKQGLPWRLGVVRCEDGLPCRS